MRNGSLRTAGVILFLFGLLFCYAVGKRRFNRTGIAGLQHYNSYGEALVTSTIERLVKIAGITAIIIGLLFMATTCPHSQKENGKRQNRTIPTETSLSKAA